MYRVIKRNWDFCLQTHTTKKNQLPNCQLIIGSFGTASFALFVGYTLIHWVWSFVHAYKWTVLWLGVVTRLLALLSSLISVMSAETFALSDGNLIQTAYPSWPIISTLHTPHHGRYRENTRTLLYSLSIRYSYYSLTAVGRLCRFVRCLPLKGIVLACVTELSVSVHRVWSLCTHQHNTTHRLSN